MARLIYVSNNVLLPDGNQNPFFLQEKRWLLEQFGPFDVICSGGLYRCEAENELKLLQKCKKADTVAAILLGALDMEAYKELIHMCKDRAVTLKNVLKLFRFSASAKRMEYFLRKSVEKDKREDTIIYSYWLSFDAAAVAKVKRKKPEIYAIARAHAYEIQLVRNACNPYLMKRLICKNLDKVFFISDNAKNGFCSYYRDEFLNADIRYLGSDADGAGYIPRGQKETLTVLTCSSILPVKYLERMIEALYHWQDGPLHWIHVGDGTDGTKIRNLAQDKLADNPLVSYEFMGYMENKQLHKFITDDAIDVFVNCSRTEGVPVSIMEAMSVGLPVIAPKMFGIPELVRDGCGLLFEQDDGYENLLNALKSFAEMSKEDREKMGKTAYEQWESDFCLQKNMQEIFTYKK